MFMGKISLITDDHPMFLAGLQQLFKKQPDFEVLGRQRARQPGLLLQKTLSLVLLDIEMPERDGISATGAADTRDKGGDAYRI
jgi:DNA-binding NarL/FixJ family response regulator